MTMKIGIVCIGIVLTLISIGSAFWAIKLRKLSVNLTNLQEEIKDA